MERKRAQYNLRLDRDVMDQVRAIAVLERRSAGMQVEVLLELAIATKYPAVARRRADGAQTGAEETPPF